LLLEPVKMKTQDFKFPNKLERNRKVILKGKVYECQGTLVMATETTCSLTKKSFKGICVGLNESWTNSELIIVGSEMDCYLENYKESK
jgi:hypothetical protein